MSDTAILDDSPTLTPDQALELLKTSSSYSSIASIVEFDSVEIPLLNAYKNTHPDWVKAFGTYLVIEQKPCMRTISYTTSRYQSSSSGNRIDFQVPLPWTYYFFTGNSFLSNTGETEYHLTLYYYAMSHERVMTQNRYMTIPYLLNTGGYSMCCGDTFTARGNNHLLASSILSDFFGRPHNSDYFPNHLSPVVSSYVESLHSCGQDANTIYIDKGSVFEFCTKDDCTMNELVYSGSSGDDLIVPERFKDNATSGIWWGVTFLDYLSKMSIDEVMHIVGQNQIDINHPDATRATWQTDQLKTYGDLLGQVVKSSGVERARERAREQA